MANTKITSANLDTLTTLTVDDITIDGSTISDSGDLTLDVGGDIVLDAAGGDISLKNAGNEAGKIVIGDATDPTVKITSGSDFSIDAAGDIILDADGSDINFKDAGTEFFRISITDPTAVTGAVLHVPVNDSSLTITGIDGGNSVTALTFDMSDAGKATFNGSIDVNGSEILVGSTNSRFAENNLRFTSSGAAYIDHNTAGQTIFVRTSKTSSLDTTAVKIESAGDITLDKNGTDYGLTLKSAGTRSGLVIVDESDNTIGSLLGVHSDDSYRLGTANYYHIQMDQNGNTTIGGGQSSSEILLGHTVKVTPSGYSSNPDGHAALNIGRDGAGETRAIDIYGSWATNENKSITFTHGTSSSNIVGQINCIHDGNGSSIRWGKLYHGADGTTYTMELKSISTTGSKLIINNSDCVGEAAINVRAKHNNTGAFVARSNNYTHPMGILPWSGVTYLSSGGSYSGGTWDYSQSNDTANGLALIGWNVSDGIRWYAGDTSAGGASSSWNHASNVQLFNKSGVMTASTGSDKRLKDNITNLSSSEALEKVNALQAVSFEWNEIIRGKKGNAYPEGTQYGFIAQDVKKVWADAHIISDTDFYHAENATGAMEKDDIYYGDIEGVRQEKLIPLLVESIKEQQTIIDDLKARIEKLES